MMKRLLYQGIKIPFSPDEKIDLIWIWFFKSLSSILQRFAAKKKEISVKEIQIGDKIIVEAIV